MYNDLCKICRVADSFMKCECEFSEVVFDDITGNVVDCDKFKAKQKQKIKCTYECGDKIAVVEKEVYNLPNLPWKDKKPKAKRNTEKFKKPTVDEINAYCAEKGYDYVNADDFINYFESVGWKVGKTLKPMTSWKGAVANWNNKQKQYEREHQNAVNKNKLQSKPTYDLNDYKKFAADNTEI